MVLPSWQLKNSMKQVVNLLAFFKVKWVSAPLNIFVCIIISEKTILKHTLKHMLKMSTQ